MNTFFAPVTEGLDAAACMSPRESHAWANVEKGLALKSYALCMGLQGKPCESLALSCDADAACIKSCLSQCGISETPGCVQGGCVKGER